MADSKRLGVDVVVVGAGVIGLCTAYYLRKAGAEVMVLSGDDRASGKASAGNAGMIVPSHVVPLAAPGAVSQGLRYLTSRSSPFHIKPRLDLDLFRWLWRFWRSSNHAHVDRAAPILRDHSLASVELFHELQEEIGDFAWEQTGLLMVYHTKKYRSENLRMADLGESLGLRIQRLDRERTLELEPGLRKETIGSILYLDDGRVNPSALLARLHEALVENRVEMVDGAWVSGLECSRGRPVRIRLEDGSSLEAEKVILAAGAWTGRLAGSLGARVPVQPAKGYSLTFSCAGEGPDRPLILSEEKVTITPLPDMLRFAGTLSLSGFDASVDERRLAPIKREASRYLGHAQAGNIEGPSAWVGFRPVSPDGLPIVGRLPDHLEVFVATGHGMTGVTMGPVTGRLVADLVSGASPIVDPSGVDPGRF